MPEDDGQAPPLTLEEPPTLALPRRMMRGAVQGLKAAGVIVGVTLVAAIAVQLLVGFNLPVAALALTLCALTSFAVGAATGRHELPPAAAATVGADGITGVSEHFRRFYPWSEVASAKQDGSELVLMVEGGYAFRIPFRDRRRVSTALARIARERAAHHHRLALGVREQRDAVEPGDEPRFIARQRKRLAVAYRHGHESVARVIAELADPDFQLQQRLGAAIALAESTDPEAARALERTRHSTASHELRDALTGLLDESATDDRLSAWIRAMHPTPRRFAPIGAVVEPDEQPDLRIETHAPRQRVEDPAIVEDPANVEDSADVEHEALSEACAELEEDASRRER